MAMPFLQANGSTDRFLSSLWTKDQMEEVRRWVRIRPYEYSNDGKVRMVKMMKTKGQRVLLEAWEILDRFKQRCDQIPYEWWYRETTGFYDRLEDAMRFLDDFMNGCPELEEVEEIIRMMNG